MERERKSEQNRNGNLLLYSYSVQTEYHGNEQIFDGKKSVQHFKEDQEVTIAQTGMVQKKRFPLSITLMNTKQDIP